MTTKEDFLFINNIPCDNIRKVSFPNGKEGCNVIIPCGNNAAMLNVAAKYLTQHERTKNYFDINGNSDTKAIAGFSLLVPKNCTLQSDYNRGDNFNIKILPTNNVRIAVYNDKNDKRADTIFYIETDLKGLDLKQLVGNSPISYVEHKPDDNVVPARRSFINNIDGSTLKAFKSRKGHELYSISLPVKGTDADMYEKMCFVAPKNAVHKSKYGENKYNILICKDGENLDEKQATILAYRKDGKTEIFTRSVGSVIDLYRAHYEFDKDVDIGITTEVASVKRRAYAYDETDSVQSPPSQSEPVNNTPAAVSPENNITKSSSNMSDEQFADCEDYEDYENSDIDYSSDDIDR